MTPSLPVSIAYRRSFPWLVGVTLAVILALVSISLSTQLLVIVPGLAIALLVLLRWPWAGVALLIASVPAQQLGSVSGGALTLTRLSLAYALAGVLIWFTVARRPVVGSRLLIPFVLLLVWMFVTAHIARDATAASSELFRWTIALFAFGAALQTLIGASERVITAVIVVIALVGALEAGFGAALGLLGFGPESFLIQDSFSRAYGTFGRPNTFAGYLEMAVFPVLWLGLYRLHQTNGVVREYVVERRAGFAVAAASRRRLTASIVLTAILLGSAAIMLTGIVISFSRGAWIGVLAGLSVSLLVSTRRYWHLILPAAPAVLIATIAVMTLVVPATLTERVTSITEEARPFDAASITIDYDNFAVAERMAHWQAGWRMFEDNPLAGVGIGNFNANYPDYFVREEFRHSQGHAHNFYIHILAETGIVGLALYITLVLSFALIALRVAFVSTDRLAGAMALGSIGTMTAVYTHNAFENLHVLNLGIQISATWALALAAHHRWATVDRAVSESVVEYSPE